LVVEPAPFTAWPDTATASIVATGDRTVTADWIRRTARRVLGVESVEIDAGHCPHVSQPERVASILHGIAA
jgi:pimeloyl-ACP methyl ester carboxylesterase